jgi:Rrf2 family iron-sulfur cluster assembly transcriptional regulator
MLCPSRTTSSTGGDMKISKAEEQAMRLAVRLASEGRQMTLADLARLERLPEPTVAKLVAKLRRGGVVTAVRGRNGGYELAGPPEEVDVASVIRSLGKPLLDGASCSVSGPQDANCPHLANCGLRSMWHHLESRLGAVLERTTLADLCRDETLVAHDLTERWPARAREPRPSLVLAASPLRHAADRS